MKQRTIVIALLNLIAVSISYGQQDPLYSQYMFNMVGINPAYAGSREVLSVTGMIRSQWVSVKGAPVSKVLIGDFSTKNKKVGVGMQVFNDQIGISSTNGVSFSYAYRLRLSKGMFAMGLQGGLTQLKANYAAIQLSGDPYDPSFAMNENKFKPSFGAGVFYSTDKYYIGASIPHLLHYNNSTKGESGARSTMYQKDHWFITGGYVFNLSHDIALKASGLLRIVSGAPITFDLNANLWFYNTISVGLSARTSNMYVAMLEIQATKQFRFGYAYDYTNSNGVRGLGSHEVMLRYEFGYEKKGMVSPRHF
jgi:type IX secretion system PorP/SprF family membrane protein